MKINYIKYKNYRCFGDVEIHFDTSKEKNISMVIAPNGGGKTEMLFSFQWVLYNFPFKKLKGKGYTPYSLNSSLYQELIVGKAGENRTCSVELCFEEGDDYFVITRSELFTKTNSGITQTEKLTLEHKDMRTGVTYPLFHDPKIINGILIRIIPKNILGGIIFDGERMKQLSQIDDDAKEAVEGVIKQITNEELFERCKIELESLSKINSKNIREYTRKRGNKDIEEIENNIKKFSDAYKSALNKIDIYKFQIEKLENDLSDIHNQLASLEDSKMYEERREYYKRQLKNESKALDDSVDKLFKDLYHGYTLITSKILSNVRENLENIDVPSGLNVSAVKSILLRDKCICGHDMTDEMKHVLKDLIKNLPPDNINSTLIELARQTEIYSGELKNTLGSTYKELSNKEESISELKNDIVQCSQLITEGTSQRANDLEKEYQEKNRKYGELQTQIQYLSTNNIMIKSQIDQLKKEREQASYGNDQLELLNKRDAFITKCITAIEAIHEENKRISLKQINSRLGDIYSSITEDVGRSLYITQFGKDKYRLISYLKENFRQLKTKMLNSGLVHKMEVAGMSDEMIDEKIILKIAQSSSTGQSKVNSLAFAKAILEYSNKERDEKSTEISKSFPFFIDSPFTELSDANLTRPAESIHTFADQIILLISNESLNSVKEYITPYVYNTTTLMKSENETTSHIKE